MTGLLKLENVRIGGGIVLLGVVLWILSFVNLVGWAVLALAIVLFLIGWFRRSNMLLMPSAIILGIAVGTLMLQFFGDYLAVESRPPIVTNIFSRNNMAENTSTNDDLSLNVVTEENTTREKIDLRGSLFIFCCGGGWVLVTLLTLRLTPTKDDANLAPKEPANNGAIVWVLIPAALMIFLGFISMQRTVYSSILRQLLIFVAQNWHIMLLAIGAYIIFEARDNHSM